MKDIIRLLAKAIEQNTVNTYIVQGSAAVDEVFKILQEVENRLKDVPEENINN